MAVLSLKNEFATGPQLVPGCCPVCCTANTLAVLIQASQSLPPQRHRSRPARDLRLWQMPWTFGGKLPPDCPGLPFCAEFCNLMFVRSSCEEVAVAGCWQCIDKSRSISLSEMWCSSFMEAVSQDAAACAITICPSAMCTCAISSVGHERQKPTQMPSVPSVCKRYPGTA